MSPLVEMIAHTLVDNVVQDYLEIEEGVEDADYLAEFAGRECYQSWDKPNPKTAKNDEYIANILRQQHFSVLEHASVTFRISDVSRSFTHELIRHRHLSFSQLSQRFVDVADMDCVVHPTLREHDCEDELETVWETAVEAYDRIEQKLLHRGLTKKQAREAAREVLPNAAGTIIDVTGNHRAWREFLPKRLGKTADAQIKSVANEILTQLKDLAPAIYQDFIDANRAIREDP